MMSQRLSALAAGIAVLLPTAVQAESAPSPSLRPAAYHVQMARGMLPAQVSQKAAPAAEPLSDSVKASVGCLMAGTTGTVLAAMAGGEEIISVIAGGGLPPTNRMVYMTGLLSVVFVSFCAVGQTMTPLYTHLMGDDEPPPRETIQVHRGAAARAQDVAARGDAAAPQAPSFRASLRQAVAKGGR